MKLTTQFINAITQEQLTQLIDGLFNQLPPEQLQSLLAAVDPELQQIFNELTVAAESTADEMDTATLPKSIDKVSEEWDSLSGKIDDIIFELGDEEGDYAIQEHHWEQPYFDEDEASEDLDKVFTKMIPLLKHCYQHELMDENFFRELIDEIQNAIAEYPEFFGAECNDFAIGSAGSECLLYWNWLNRSSIEQFIDSSSADFKKLPLTQSFTPSCFADEQQTTLKELYQILPKKLSNELLNDVSTFWHTIYHLTQGATDRKSFLKASAELINQNWQYGITVYEDFMQHSEFKQAETYCQRTIAEAFRQHSYSDFNTNFTQAIFAIHCQLYDEVKLHKIFTDWKTLSQQAGLEDNLPAINIQEQFYLNADDCQTILQCFKELQSSQYFSTYMQEWALHITRKIISSYTSTRAVWIAAIVKFAIDHNQTAAMTHISAWLEELKLKNNRDNNYTQFFYLSRYCFDHNSLSNYPLLHKLVQKEELNIFYDSRAEKPWVVFIKPLLQQLDITLLQQQLLKLWTDNICKFVPELTVTNGKYADHAKWLALALELHPKAAGKILQQWRNKHHLKRNLWQELATYGITKKV